MEEWDRTQSMRLDRVEDDIAAKVARQVDEMRCLFDDGPAVTGLHPPSRLGDFGVRAYVPRNGRHDVQIIVLDDASHLLDDFEIAQKVAHRNDRLLVDERLLDSDRVLDGARADRLLDKELRPQTSEPTNRRTFGKETVSRRESCWENASRR